METLLVTEKEFMLERKALVTEKLSITMGYFDGLHRGHQELFNKTKTIAKDNQLASAVITFDFSNVTNLKKQYRHLLTDEETAGRLQKLDIDYYIIIQFGEQLKSMSPKQYVEQLVKLFNIKAITVGEDFCFGKNRSGNLGTLKELANEFDYQVNGIPIIKNVEQKISSSDIEQLIVKGDFSEVNKLLGYPYQLSGIVIHGEQKGRQIGFPTANMIVPVNKVIPQNGVYVVQIIMNDKIYEGMTNIGIAPTLKNISNHIIETNIFDFSDDIYGETIDVLFYKRIRDEQKFNGIDALKAQLAADVEYSKNYFNEQK